MCGIAGIFWHSKPTQDVAITLEKWSKVIRHRGPDGAGYLLVNENETIECAGYDTPEIISNEKALAQLSDYVGNATGGFLHRRLSIIDLSAGGHQPMADRSKRYFITYNGEIYNYKTLRAELQSLGYSFSTKSDTEVVLNAYIEWGSAMLAKLDGMWAFSIFDQVENKLFAARDRLGVKPYYFAFNNHFFAFASEQKVFRSADILKPEIRTEAVFDFFAFRHTETEDEGFLKGIVELKPSHCLTLNLKDWQLKTQAYYEITAESNNGLDFETNVKLIREKIEYAVQSHLIADVPVGACLSGGLDSSAIVGIAAKGFQENLFHAFTAIYPGHRLNEARYAKEVAERNKARWIAIEPNPQNLMSDLSAMVYALDVPLWSTSTYAQFLVMRSVQANHIKVVLDGQGADELFAGYAPHLLYHHFDPSNNQSALSKLMSKPFNNKTLMRFWFEKLVFPQLSTNNQLKLMRSKFIDFNYLNTELAEQHKDRLQKITPQKPASLKEELALEMATSLKAYLRCEDRCAMWHSVESRTPFSSSLGLLEFARTIPTQFLVQQGELKHIYRKAIAPFIPESVLNRKDKLGFTTPNNEWIDQLSDQFEAVFTNQVSSYLDVKRIKKDLSFIFKRPQEAENGRLFKLIAFAKWVDGLR